MSSTTSLYNFGFLTLNLFVLFAFSNLAVFFSFYSFLQQLPITPYWHGILIGLLSASVLVLRPLISTRLNAANSIRATALALGLTVLSLLLYAHVQSLVPMILLRILHGAAYVTMLSASVTLFMECMPTDKSGQGFGFVTIMTLLPYAIIPFLLENVFPLVPLGSIYTYTAALMVPPALLLIPLAHHLRAQKNKSSGDREAQPRAAFLNNLRQPQVLMLLAANGLFFSVFSLFFFFLKTFCANSDIGNPGLFFTTSTGVTIGIRVFFGALFDKYNKALLAVGSLLVFVYAFFLLTIMASDTIFYVAAVLYGVGVGAATPLMNGLMFSISKPQYRALNTNLMLEMVDAGFFIGPALCGVALATGLERSTILTTCMFFIFGAIALIFPLRNIPSQEYYDKTS